MYTQKLGSLMATFEKAKPEQSSDKDTQHRRDEYVRRGLLVWASLRLAVSVLWTGLLVVMTWQTFTYIQYQQDTTHYSRAPSVFMFGVMAIVLQVVELGMIVTFICAGVKKSASLYRAYYYYCILTLIFYIITMTLLILGYGSGRYFGEFYLTYNINEFFGIKNDAFVFGVAAILDICLELLLIRLIKRLINKYKDEKITNCENV